MKLCKRPDFSLKTEVVFYSRKFMILFSDHWNHKIKHDFFHPTTEIKFSFSHLGNIAIKLHYFDNFLKKKKCLHIQFMTTK